MPIHGNYKNNKPKVIISNSKIKKKEETKKTSTDTVDDLVNWSMTPHTEEELRDTMLAKKTVYVTYICKHTPMTEEFIIEFTGLSTGEFNYVNYNKEACMIIGHLMMLSQQERDHIIELGKLVKTNNLSIDELPEPFNKLDKKYLYLLSPLVRDRIDWLNIGKYQNMSNEFIEKYKSVLKNFAY